MAIQDTIDSGMNSAMPPMASLVLNSPDSILKSLGGEYVTKTITLVAGGAAAAYNCFTFTGAVEFWGLYGAFTVVSAGALSRASFRWFVAGAAVADITLINGTNCALAAVGSLVAKKLDAASAADFINAESVAGGGIMESARDATLKCFTMVARSGATNTIQFVADTDGATSGAIKMVALWRPLNSIGTVVAS